VARSYSSNARYRTGLTGWYVRTDESLAVGEDGEYYVLRVPSELWGRVVGVRVSPQDPPLVVGVGARDGESRALRDLLGDRLERGDVQG